MIVSFPNTIKIKELMPTMTAHSFRKHPAVSNLACSRSGWHRKDTVGQGRQAAMERRAKARESLESEVRAGQLRAETKVSWRLELTNKD